MDGKRFDDISRALARERTRRGLVKGLVGGLAAGVAALAGRGQASAQRLPNGSACTRSSQCASFKCADGVCCDTACTGQCEACNLQGAAGVCTPVPAGTQQWGNRPACTGTDVCQASCDGVTRTHCTHYPGLDIVCGPSECDHGWGINYGCGGDGTCHPLLDDCGPYTCDEATGICRTTCTIDAHCADGAVCVNGRCVDKLPLGEACTADGQCQSGLCVNGVCCAERCGTCEVCNAPASLGFCAAGPDNVSCGLDDLCCEGECVDVQIDVEHCGICDNTCIAIPNSRAVCIQSECDIVCLPGFQRCDFPTLICIPESGCCGDTECPGTQFCDLSTHTCAPDRPVGGSCTRNCGPLPANECSTDAMCLSGICRESAGVCGCGVDADCAPSEWCDGSTNVCMPDRPLGQSCNRAAMCIAGICNADGPTCGCGNVRLSGSADPNAPFLVDNHLFVYLNGNLIISQESGPPWTLGPYNIEANPFDVLRIQITDFGGLQGAGPFYLHCLATGAVQVLDATGVPFQPSPPGASPTNHVTIYDRSFSVNL